MADAIANPPDGDQERRIEGVAETIWRSYPHNWIPRLIAELEILAEVEMFGKQAGSTIVSVSNISRKMPCPHCRDSLEIPPDTRDAQLICGNCGRAVDLVEAKNSTRFRPPIKRIGNYEIIEFLDSGSFGSVWKARDVSLLAAVAIKIPHKKPLTDEDNARIKSEARAQGQLDHPNIVRIRQVVDDGETLFIVSDLIRGIRLSDRLTQDQPTIREAVQWCVKISGALHHAHQHRVFHRDLKPGNILIDGDGEPHLTDFGLAKHDLDRVTVTQDGQVLGTAAYMSAEQADGRSHHVDGRSDVYSLGVVLFELLTGHLPFRGNERAIIHAHVHEPAPSPRKFNDRVERDLETICLKCLEKDPAQRFQSADELRRDLERYLNGEPILSRPISRAARAWRWCKRKPLVAGLSAAVAAALLVGTAVSSYFAVKATNSETAMESALYRSIVEEARSRNAVRREGYRAKVLDLVNRALALPTAEVDREELRQVAVKCLGDFVGLDPIVLRDFPGNAFLKALALDPSGTQLAAGFEDGSVAVYDVPSGRWKSLAERHQGEIQSLRYTANGSQIVSVATEGAIKTWTRDANGNWNHEESLALSAVADPKKFKFELTPDGTSVLARRGSRIWLWDIAEGKIVMRVAAGEGRNFSLAAISPDRKWLAFTFNEGKDRWLGLSDITTGLEVKLVPMDQEFTSALVFSPNSKWVVRVSDSGLTMFDIPTFREREVDRSGPIKAAAFSSDSQQLATFGIRGDVVLRRALTSTVTAGWLHERTYTSYATGVEFSEDGGTCASFDRGSIRLWRLRATPERIVLDGHAGAVPCVVFGPDGAVVVSTSKDKTVKLWDPADGTLRDKKLDAFKGDVQNAVFSPDGQLLATAQWDVDKDHIQFWDTQTWKPVPAEWLTESKDRPPDKAPRFQRVNRIAFSAAGKDEYLASAVSPGIVLWRMRREMGVGGRVAALRFEFVRYWPGDRCYDCAFSSDGKLLVWVQKEKRANKSNEGAAGSSAQEHYRLRLWDFARQQEIDLPDPRPLQEWHSLVFFPNDPRLAFIGESKRPEVWRLPEGVHELTLDTAELFIAPHMALNRKDGKWFAGKISPAEVVIWDMSRRKRMFALRSEASEVISLDWSPDGRRLALGLHDGRVVVWDLPRVNDELSALGLNWDAAWDPLESTCRHASLSIL